MPDLAQGMIQALVQGNGHPSLLVEGQAVLPGMHRFLYVLHQAGLVSNPLCTV